MIRLIESFSIRAQPSTAREAGNTVVDSFCCQTQGHNDVTRPGDVVTDRFAAALTLFHVPRGDAVAFKSFSLVPSGQDLYGTVLPEHERVETDILRYHANG